MKFNIIEHPILKMSKDVKKQITHKIGFFNKYKTYEEFLWKYPIDIEKYVIEQDYHINIKSKCIIDNAMAFLLLSNVGIHYFVEDISTFMFLEDTDIKSLSPVSSVLDSELLDYPIKLFGGADVKYMNFIFTHYQEPQQSMFVTLIQENKIY